MRMAHCYGHSLISRGGVGRCPPPLKSHAPPLGKNAMIDQNENLTIFYVLLSRKISTDRKCSENIIIEKLKIVGQSHFTKCSFCGKFS
jgi:hypothetical protein